MKKFFRIGLAVLFLIFAMACWKPAADAATPNYPEIINGIQIVPFHISGPSTTTTIGVVKFQIPFKAQVLGISATARASGGTSPTLTVDVKEAGTSILSAPMSITAGTVTEAVVSDNMLADEAAITVDITIGGTSPIWNDITVILTLRRTN